MLSGMSVAEVLRSTLVAIPSGSTVALPGLEYLVPEVAGILEGR